MNPSWTPETGQIVKIDTAAMRGRNQFGVVMRQQRDGNVLVKWIKQEGVRKGSRRQAYNSRSIIPAELDAVTSLAFVAREDVQALRAQAIDLQERRLRASAPLEA